MQLVTGTSDSSDLPVEHALEKRGEVGSLRLILAKGLAFRKQVNSPDLCSVVL